MTRLRSLAVAAPVLLAPLGLLGCAGAMQGQPGTAASGTPASSQAVSAQAATAPAVPGGGMQAAINGFTRGTTTYAQAVSALGQPVSSTAQPDGYRLATWRAAAQGGAGAGMSGGMLQQGLGALGSSGHLGSYGSMAASMLPQLQGAQGQGAQGQGAQGQAAPGQAAGGSYQLVFDRSGIFQGVDAAAPAATSRGIDPSQLLRLLPGHS